MLRITDQVGSLRSRWDLAGNMVTECTSFPYGEGYSCTGATPPTLYTGKDRDPETGFDYFGARYYNSTMGRFMSPDDVGGHLEDPQTLNLYSYVGNNPLSRTDPSGHDFWQSCQTQSSTCGNQVISKGTDGKDITQLVSGTTDKSGNFSATVITSASLGQAGSGNTATVNGNGLTVTTGTGTSGQQSGQGIFINGTASADIKGSGTGFDQFSFHIDRNDAAHGVLSEGTANYTGQGGYQGMVNAINSASVNGKGPFSYTLDRLSPFHPGSVAQDRFSPGDHPEFKNYGPSPHFPVPSSGTNVPGFHVDNGTGPFHEACALTGKGCY